MSGVTWRGASLKSTGITLPYQYKNHAQLCRFKTNKSST